MNEHGVHWFSNAINRCQVHGSTHDTFQIYKNIILVRHLCDLNVNNRIFVIDVGNRFFSLYFDVFPSPSLSYLVQINKMIKSNVFGMTKETPFF